MTRPGIAYQIYSAREEAAKDLRRVLSILKEQGYEGVELAGFYSHTPEQIKTMLDDLGLKAASSHVPLKTMQEDPQGVIRQHLALACKYLAIPYIENAMQPGNPGFAQLFPFIYRFGAMCRDAGITLLYHNHDFEFEKVSGAYGLDFLFSAVPADLLQTEIDTCWVKYAGVDPVNFLNQYKGRAPVVHLKDFVGFKGDVSPYHLIGMADNPDVHQAAFAYRPFGYGVQDVKALTRAAVDAGATWLVIEQDESPDQPPLEAGKMSIDTLKKLLA